MSAVPAVRLVRLVLVTDRALMGGGDVAAFAHAIDRALSLVAPGSALVQVREKELSGRELLAFARAAVSVAHARGALVVVNDRVDIALAVGADGVHLPEHGLSIADARALLGADRIVGVSRHSIDTARAAAALADLVVLGPIFPTPSKVAFGAPLGPAALTAALTPRANLVAIGGIDSPARAAACRAAGASAVAAIRAIWSAADPASAARSLIADVPPDPLANPPLLR